MTLLYKGPFSRMILFDTFVNNNISIHFRLMAYCPPTGSTAYSLSAEAYSFPELELMLMLYYTLYSRPMVIGPDNIRIV